MPLRHWGPEGSQEGFVSLSAQLVSKLQHTSTVTNTVTVYKWVFLVGNGRLDKTLKEGARRYFYFVCPHSELTAKLSQHSWEKRVTAFPNRKSYSPTPEETLLWQLFVNRTTRLEELEFLAYEHTAGRRMAVSWAVRFQGTGLTVAFLSQGWDIFWLSNFSVSEYLKDKVNIWYNSVCFEKEK